MVDWRYYQSFWSAFSPASASSSYCISYFPIITLLPLERTPQLDHVLILTPLPGAIWADLVPTVIALAIYFCFADFVLIGQCLYYNHINSRSARQNSIISVSSDPEHEPLLTRRRSSDTIGLPGSHRRRSSARSGTSQRDDSLSKILEEDDSPNGNPWLKNALSILGVVAVGTAGWAIAWQSGVWTPTPEDGDVPAVKQSAFGAEVLGYISAVC